VKRRRRQAATDAVVTSSWTMNHVHMVHEVCEAHEAILPTVGAGEPGPLCIGRSRIFSFLTLLDRSHRGDLPVDFSSSTVLLQVTGEGCASGVTSAADWTLEWLLAVMGSHVDLQVITSRECSLAVCAAVVLVSCVEL